MAKKKLVRKRTGKVEFKQSKINKRWYWILKSGNGHKVARAIGGRQVSYATKKAAVYGYIDTVELITHAEIVQ